MSPTFFDLGVPVEICRALEARGITEPFAIQRATVEDALAGRDICGRAPTGSGKTLAFGIPLVASTPQGEPHRPRSLVLAPTRELAEQIAVEMRRLAPRQESMVASVYGGVSYKPQLAALRRRVDILVACPGRLEDLINSNDVSLADVDRVVLDEADRMADMGFMPAVKRLLDRTSKDRQTLLFSATLDGDVAELTRKYQRDPVRHEVGEATPDLSTARHVFWRVARADRVDLSAKAITANWPSIVFCRTRHGADRLVKQLRQRGVDAAAIHGGRSQSQRTRALDQFGSGDVQALIATDVAARGIHVEGVASVIHFDPPEDHKAYIHRSGRTARAGSSGVVISLCQPEQAKDVKKMQKTLALVAPLSDPDGDLVADVEPRRAKPAEQHSAPAQPKKKQQQRRQNGHTPNHQRSGKSSNGKPAGKSSNGKPSNGRPNGKPSNGKPSNGKASGSKRRSGPPKRNGQGGRAQSHNGSSHNGSGHGGQSRPSQKRRAGGGAKTSGRR